MPPVVWVFVASFACLLLWKLGWAVLPCAVGAGAVAAAYAWWTRAPLPDPSSAVQAIASLAPQAATFRDAVLADLDAARR